MKDGNAHRISKIAYRITFLLISFSIFDTRCSIPSAHAQGFLPTAESSSTITTTSAPILIGDKVPGTFTVLDESGKARTLLSYKSAIEILVLIFLTSHCPANQTVWPELRRINENYKEWRVAFLAITASAGETVGDLANTLKAEKLPWPAAQADAEEATTLQISQTPEALVLDEYGVLKYRGPVKRLRRTLDTVIGHTEEVSEPEPPVEGGCPL